MITPKQNDTKVIFGACRMSYVHVFNKYIAEGETDGKYCVTILVPKTEKETISALQAAIEAAKKNAVTSKWGGKLPAKLDSALRDGDDKDDENFHGHYYLNAKCSTRPGVVDKYGVPIQDEDEFYSGVWALASVTFYGYKVSGNSGIACGLNNLKKYKDDDHLGGRTSAESDFAGIDMDDDDDL